MSHPPTRRVTAVLTLLTVIVSMPASAQSGAPVTPGFANVPRIPGELLSGLNAPQQGRTAIIAYHNGILYTVPEVPSSQPGADFIVRSWDLADPRSPRILATHGITPMPINAHGYFKSGEYLVLGSNWPPESPWSFRAVGPLRNERTAFPDLLCAGVRGCLFQPWFVGDTYWSYGAVGGDAFIERNGQRLSSWDHLGLTGVIGHPFILGDLLIFASDQSRTGVATYDIGDPANPVLLDVLTDGGPGGYWPELWGGDGRLYVVFPYRVNGNGFRVVDVTDPTDMRFVADRALPGAASMYIQFQDHHAFMGQHKVDMRTLTSVLDLDAGNVQRTSDGGTGVDTSQFLLPLGNLLVTGGIGENEGMAIWAHQAEPDRTGPQVGYHIPRAGRTDYPRGAPISLLIHETLETHTVVNGDTFVVRPVGGAAIDGRIIFAFDDVLTFTPTSPLAADTTYEVILREGGIKDAAGNGMQGYLFRFSTGASVAGNAAPAVGSLTTSTHPVPPGGSVTLIASASDPDGDALEYRFDAGDGRPRGDWSERASVDLSYPQAGHFRATVQVRDALGAIATGATTVTVLAPIASAPPGAGSGLACDAASDRVYAVNPDNDSVTAMALSDLSTSFETPTCRDPRNAVVVGDELWVSCHDDDAIAILDAGSGASLARLDLGHGSAPHGLVASPDGDDVYVALQGAGRVRAYTTSTRRLRGELELGPTPRALAVSGDGRRLLVTRLISPRDHAEVWDVDTSDLSLSATVRIPRFGGETNRDGTAAGRGVANYLTGIAIAPDGLSAWVSANKPNTDRGLLTGVDLDQDNTVRNLVMRLDLQRLELAAAIDVDNSDSASALAFSPLGDYLLVALQGNDEIAVLDLLGDADTVGLGAMVARIGVGRAPQAICVDPIRGRSFVNNLLSRDVTAIDTDTLFRGGGITPAMTAVPTVSQESMPAQVLRGKQIFYAASDPRMSPEGYLSCASCHLDGGQDGRVWDFTGRGEGLRNTVSLRGRAGLGHGNVHWSGNFDEIQDFENDIRLAFGGRGFLDDDDFDRTRDPLGPAKSGLDDDLDALAAYVASLAADSVPRSPHRGPGGRGSFQGLLGGFVALLSGCTACHSGAGLTDSRLGEARLHDVGTMRTTSGQRLGAPLNGIDTPGLRGIWNTAPYLHDGSAADLAEVFEASGGVTLAAESGTPLGGANTVDRWVELNNDDTVRGRAYVSLGNSGAMLRLTNVDGGSGGDGAIELRYSASDPEDAAVRVNGVAFPIVLPALPNEPGWRHTHWGRLRIQGIPLLAGPGNVLEIVATDPWPDISLDEVTVSNADTLEAAQAHRRIGSLSPVARDWLQSFLRELE